MDWDVESGERIEFIFSLNTALRQTMVFEKLRQWAFPSLGSVNFLKIK